MLIQSIALVVRCFPQRMATVVEQLGSADMLWFATLAFAWWRRLHGAFCLTMPAPSLGGWYLMAAMSPMGRAHQHVLMGV